jgi:hypothetical protein
MRTGDLRRLEGVERSLTSSSLYVPDSLSDAQLIEALENGTATPAHMKQIYDICAPHLEVGLFREAKRWRDIPDVPRADRADTQRFAMAAEMLWFRADEEPGFRLEWLAFEPHRWLATEGRPGSHHPFFFSMWARSALVELLLDHDPLALESRRRLDAWCDGGDPPVDLLRYPDPRQYRLLNPISSDVSLSLDIQMLRYPHKKLCGSLGFYPFDDPSDEGLLWTEVDTFDRMVIPSEYEGIMSWGLHSSWRYIPPAGPCGDSPA